MKNKHISKVAVFSHKMVWKCENSQTGYASDGGFPFQMRAISQLFNSTVLYLPLVKKENRSGEIPIEGHNINIYPLKDIGTTDLKRKLLMPIWISRHIFTIVLAIKRADAVHVPIPSDFGTLGMIIAKLMNKPLLVRYCGNWAVERTAAERFWHRFMIKNGGGKNVMLATGGDIAPPSKENPNIRWIFSTSLTSKELSELSKYKPVLDPAAPRLAITGRQEKGKGTEKILEVLPLLIEKYPLIHLDVIGDGDFLNELKAKAVSLRLESAVTFHGKVNHEKVLKILQSAHIFTFPTSSEGFPKAVLEAMACGLPVITNPVSVLPILLGNGSGILLENSELNVLADAISSIVDNPVNYNIMQTKAQETAQNYTLEKWRDTIGKYLYEAWPEYGV